MLEKNPKTLNYLANNKLKEICRTSEKNFKTTKDHERRLK